MPANESFKHHAVYRFVKLVFVNCRSSWSIASLVVFSKTWQQFRWCGFCESVNTPPGQFEQRSRNFWRWRRRLRRAFVDDVAGINDGNVRSTIGDFWQLTVMVNYDCIVVDVLRKRTEMWSVVWLISMLSDNELKCWTVFRRCRYFPETNWAVDLYADWCRCNEIRSWLSNEIQIANNIWDGRFPGSDFVSVGSSYCEVFRCKFTNESKASFL